MKKVMIGLLAAALIGAALWMKRQPAPTIQTPPVMPPAATLPPNTSNESSAIQTTKIPSTENKPRKTAELRPINVSAPAPLPVAIPPVVNEAPIASEPLEERLLSADTTVSQTAQSEVATLSADQKSELAFSILKTVKRVEDPAKRTDAANKAGVVLVRLGPAALPALIAGLSDSVAVIRMKSAYAIGEFGAFAKEALPPLIHNAKKDPDMFARCDAIDALGKMGAAAEEAIPTLISGINDENSVVRSRAVEAVGNIGPKATRAVSDLVRVLRKDSEVYTRGSAAKSLGQIGPSAASAVPDLITALDNSDKRVKMLSLGALKRIATPDALAAVKAATR